MKRLVASAALVTLCAAAAPGLAADQPAKGAVGVGEIKTSNVTRIATIPVDTDVAGGRMVGEDFFVRTAKGITVYDTSDPERPTPKGFVAVPATPNQEREDIDTNGEVLVTGQAYDGRLYVVDVRDRRTPTVIGVLAGGADHTNTCVLDCTYVYGSEGTIVDLRDPANPKLVAKKWTSTTVPAGHDLTEVTPGRVLVASNPVTYLDASNPEAPRKLTEGKLPDSRYMHGVAWPRAGEDRFVLGGSETSLGCQGELGSFVVWDTTTFKEAKPGSTRAQREFVRTGQYQVQRGLQTELEGEAPAAQHCGHWFDTHPTYEDGGLVAMAWYTSGVRFLEVGKDGSVEEKGFWQPLPGQSSAAYWASEDVLYVTDYTARGFDVLKYDRTTPAQPSELQPGLFVEAGSAREAAAVVKAGDLASAHHGSTLAALAQKWVCKPDGTMALAG